MSQVQVPEEEPWKTAIYFWSSSLVFFFQAEDGIRDAELWLEFRRVLFRSKDLAEKERLKKKAEAKKKKDDSVGQLTLF